MKTKRQYKNWLIDVFLLVGFLFCFYLELTGMILHQWLGALIFILAAVHFFLHWDWVKCVTVRLFKRTNSRNRWYYLVDTLLIMGFVVIAETGLVISTWFNLTLENYHVWHDLHIFSSIATLALCVIKVGLHWHWVVNTTLRIFSSGEQAISRPALVPALVSARGKNNHMERREFLALMGVVGLGSLLAVSNVFSTRLIENEESRSGTDLSLVETEVSVNPDTQQAGSADLVPKKTARRRITTEDGPDITVTEAPQQTSSGSGTPNCQVRCSRSCSFPGRCRRYVDQNANGKCDLGECM